jgi:hypothetical protein
MSINNREAANEYFEAVAGNGTIQTVELAETTDRAMAAMLEVFKEAGVRFPNDDRCANIEVEIFKAAKFMLEGALI